MAFCYQNSILLCPVSKGTTISGGPAPSARLFIFLLFFQSQLKQNTAVNNIGTVLVRKADSVARFMYSIISASISIPWEHVSWFLLVFSEVAVSLATTEAVVSHYFSWWPTSCSNGGGSD